MIFLEDLNNTKLSYGIRDLSPLQYDSIQVKNKLLDGSYHIQNIGEPMRYFTFEVLANHIQVDLINLAECRSEPFRLIIDDKYYIGMIEEIEEWTLLALNRNDKTKTIYSTIMRFNISQEGTL